MSKMLKAKEAFINQRCSTSLLLQRAHTMDMETDNRFTRSGINMSVAPFEDDEDEVGVCRQR